MMNTGTALYVGITRGLLMPGFVVDEVVAALPAESETVSGENVDECLVVGRPERRHQATLTVE